MKLKTNFLGRVNDIPLNFKFLIIYVVCLLLPIIIINSTFLDRFSKIVHEREENNYKISMDRTKVDLDKIIEGCIAISYSISTDRSLYNELDRYFEDSGQYYEAYDSILRNKLNMYTTAYDYISSIGIYVNNPTIRTGGTYYYIDDTVKNMPWYEDVSSLRGKVLIKTYIGNTQSLPTRQIQYLSVFKNSDEYAISNDREEKILKLDIDLNKLYNIFKREKQYLNLYLIDSQNNIVCSSGDPYNFDKVRGFEKYGNDLSENDNMVIQTTLGNASYLKGWRLIGVANRGRIAKSINETLIYVLTFAFASLLISSLLIFIIVRSYNYRLKKLSKHMLKLKDGQFDLIEITEGRDEIGGVIRNFNLMAEKINTLINDVYKLDLQKKNLELERVRAEINFLQSQMNPHFLFNTLNAVLVVCVKNNYIAIIDVIKYLSKTLRRLLSWKDDLVKIEEELSFTEMYLKIEKFRFCDKFEYSISVDDNLLTYKIPKMSLQPLVENACKHGIQAIKGVGIVNISIVMNESGLKVCVEDNGSGMNGSKLDQLLQDVTNDEELTTSIGIRNVYRRLRLYYGESTTFNIESKIDQGTRVYFVIPCEKL